MQRVRSCGEYRHTGSASQGCRIVHSTSSAIRSLAENSASSRQKSTSRATSGKAVSAKAGEEAAMSYSIISLADRRPVKPAIPHCSSAPDVCNIAIGGRMYEIAKDIVDRESRFAA